MITKQIVFTEINKAELIDAEYEKPKADEVTVSIEYSAISRGTELAKIRGDPNVVAAGEPTLKFPRYAGYSAAGVVTDIGSEVTDIKVGDRVIVFWGFHKKIVTVNRYNVVKIPDGVSAAEASMVLISTFPLAAIRKCKLEIGESAMVMGLGILGMFAVQELKAAGAYPIIAVDPVAERREFALKMGADYALALQRINFVIRSKKSRMVA